MENPYNNYSYPRNYNPNTGKITTGVLKPIWTGIIVNQSLVLIPI